ncbi:MAG: Rho termination factor N-terminal domain-containing protein, partial [Treponema sp.]|nr:Rho termination factor N-terminal domain-containing protein [Treponema sp.]
MAILRKGRKPATENDNSYSQESNNSQRNESDNGERNENSGRVIVRGRKSFHANSTERIVQNEGSSADSGNRHNNDHSDDSHSKDASNQAEAPHSPETEQDYKKSEALPAIPKLPSMPDLYGKPIPRQDQDNSKPRLTINELIRLNMKDLRELAACYNITHDDMVVLKKQEIVFALLKAHTERGGIIYAYGSLEILPDSYGFLRSPQNSYLPGPDDIYISPSQIRLFALKTGDTVYGQIRSPKGGERYFAMLRVEPVNYDDPTVAQHRIPFDNLTPLYPDGKLDLETATEGISERII